MSSLKQRLESALGKPIDDICPNNFHDHQSNHCAHFVSHMTDLQFSYNCREFQGGDQQPANIRVHEIFAKCPRVGKFSEAPEDRPVLVFVTRVDVVDLATKSMQNIPQKHIGVLVDDFVYHYSNSQERVVKWTPQEFLDTFERIYTGRQALFFGTIPGSDIPLHIDPSGTGVRRGIAFELSKRDGNKWFARAINATDDRELYVGREIRDSSRDYFGIYQKTAEYYGPRFQPDAYIGDIDHWAYLLYITGHCESKNYFNVFNTYDRAKFTYGFYQLAAHTPGDNLILLIKRALGLDRAKDYFPELGIIDGRLHRINEDGGTTDLEEAMPTGPNGAQQLQLFMNFLNPFRRTIEEQEVLQVARLMHWTANDAAFRQLQVAISNEILQKKMTERYSGWYRLHGKSDLICALIADIHHQGRASRQSVTSALSSRDPVEALMTISPRYGERIASLRQITSELRDLGKLGAKTYDAANNEFI